MIEWLNYENEDLLWSTSQMAALYLEVSALFINGDDESVHVSDEFIPLCLPQAFSAFLQQLHQHLLNTHRRRNANSAPLQRQLLWADMAIEIIKTFRVGEGLICFLLSAHADQIIKKPTHTLSWCQLAFKHVNRMWKPSPYACNRRKDVTFEMILLMNQVAEEHGAYQKVRKSDSYTSLLSPSLLVSPSKTWTKPWFKVSTISPGISNWYWEQWWVIFYII